jgi:transposase
MQLYAGLDVHSEFTYGTIVDGMGNPMRELKVPTTSAGFSMLFAPLRDKHKIRAVFEASRNWWYTAQLLKQQGIEAVMAHPLRVRAIASARIKTDAIDSKVLSDLLRADLVPESYMPTDEIVELRNLVRYRVRLGRMGAQMKNSIRAVLSRQGYKCAWTDPAGKKAALWLANLELSDQNRMELSYLLGHLSHLKREIDKLDDKIRLSAVSKPEAKLIMSIPGFAEYSAMLILAEIGDFKRFPTPQKLAAYAGLVSSTYQSGNGCYQGRITKQGSRWLRWILVECSTIAIRKPNRLQRFYLRIKHKKGHQKAIVATARKAITIIWTLLHKQQQFQP